MSFEVIHPGWVIRPCGRVLAAEAAIRAENHVPSPHDMRLNIFTDASPAVVNGVGGVGVCYGGWLPTHPNNLTRSLSYVVPRVRDPNECELVALADAALVVLDEINENITALRANNWSTRVMIWSDSHTALKYLQDPSKFKRFGKGGPEALRSLILRLVGEINSLPVKGPIEFYWMPGLCTNLHKTADFMTKNALVKAGKAPISRAMKMLFPKPRAGPRPVAQTAPLAASGSMDTEFDFARPGGNKQAAGQTTTKKTSEWRGIGNRNNKLKRRASVDVDVDNNRPRKATRRNEQIAEVENEFISSSKVSPSGLYPPATRPSPKLQPHSVQSLAGHAKPSASTLQASNQEEVIFVAIDHIIRHSREPESLETIWKRAGRLQEDQKHIIQDAMKRQLLANQKPFDPVHFFLRMDPASEGTKMEACFPNTLSIIEDAVGMLPDPIRIDMQKAVQEQHEENRLWAAHLAIMQCLRPQAQAILI